MGADQNIDLAILRVGNYLILFLSGAEARQLFNHHRPVGKAVAEVL